jgi:glyoxylase-like metal-dependent hydrolase (beta-lactamase superfamily II)
MTEELYPGLYRIHIPLPESPLKYLNSYVIKGKERNLIIDTGLNRDVCKKAMMEGLDELGISLDSVDLFITHLHADHFGLVSQLAQENTQIYFNRPDSELIENWQGFEPMIKYGGQSGFPEDLLRNALSQHPGFKYGTGWMPSLSLIADGQKLSVGDYTFTCIQTPGHTNGHTCLYEAEKKIFIAGDHILYDITPNIQCWSDEGDPLGSYMASLDKVRGLEVSQALPGHRNLFTCFKERIDELKEHHSRRLEEVIEILQKKSPQNAFEVASQMTWDLKAKSWEDFPLAQKWFATGEAISHLRYLEKRNRIRRAENQPVILYEHV